MRLPLALATTAFVLSIPFPSRAAARDAQTPAQQPASASCTVADDPQYALTEKMAAQVGGGPMYGAARQRRYLDALRSPDGQPLRYKRAGTVMLPDETLVDRYEITYDGLDKPVHVFLDWYHFDEPKAPKGFACGQPMNLGLPPADPFVATPEILALAIEQGTAREIAALHGRPWDPKSPPKEWMAARTVVIAQPLTCDDRTVVPDEIALVTPQGQVVPRDESDRQKDALARLLPDFELPAQSVAAIYKLDFLRPGLTVQITYREPACPEGTRDVAVPVRFVPPRIVESPSPALPSGVTAAGNVFLQVVIDLDGALRRATVIGGPAELTKAAVSTIETWKAEPARVNGTPVVVPIVIAVPFKPATPE